MQQFDLALGLVLVVSSLGTAMMSLLLFAYLQPARRISWTPVQDFGEPVVFLFRDRHLVDATADARALLATGPDFLDEWPRVLAVLEPRFPGLADEIASLPELQHFILKDAEGSDLEAEWRGGLARIVLHERQATEQADAPDRYSQAALDEELATLRCVVDGAPMLVWKEDPTGNVRWANGAYVALAERMVPDGGTVGWPLPRIFDQRPVGSDNTDPPRRLRFKVDGDSTGDSEEIWFDSYCEAQDGDTMVFALPADKLVEAEASQREFLQTLTKTFAHLPTGLAVFDRERRLALFNPALTDLSALAPQFLSSRPSLFDFLDRLRHRQRAPEPKDFKSWKRQIVDLESAAASGTYQETWSLPGGQTYRVTGRPHPDGAIAFLFEDISSEISLARNFRAELELGQSVLDGLETAVVVFNANGSLIHSNLAYRELWGHDPDAVIGDTGVTDATHHWAEVCVPTPAWGDLRDFVADQNGRAEWSAEVRRKDGPLLNCRFVPLVGHATLVTFLPEMSMSEGVAPQENISATLSGSLR